MLHIYQCYNIIILHTNYMPNIPEHLDLLPRLCTWQYTNLQDNPTKSGKVGNYDFRQESGNIRLWLWVRGELWDFTTLPASPSHVFQHMQEKIGKGRSISDVMMTYLPKWCHHYITKSKSFSYMCWKTWEGMVTRLPTHKEIVVTPTLIHQWCPQQKIQERCCGKHQSNFMKLINHM